MNRCRRVIDAIEKDSNATHANSLLAAPQDSTDF